MAAAALCAAAWIICLPVSAATIFETTEVLANTPEADTQLPQVTEFDVAAATDMTVTLRDLNAPALLTSLRAIVTSNLEVVAELELTYPEVNSVPVVAPTPATQAFAAAPGHYRVHVVGAVADGEAGGTFGLTVAPTAGGASLVDAADVITAANAPAAGQTVLKMTFEIANAGSYDLALDDLAFPEALASTNLLLLYRAPSGDEIVATAPGPFTALAGTYELIVIATAGGAEQAGLYRVRVAGGPASILAYPGADDPQTNRVGRMPPATSVNFSSAGDYTLTLADPAFPAALQSFGVAVIQNGALLGSSQTAGTSTVTAVQGDAELFVLATPVDVGVLSVRLARGSQIAYADVTIADSSPDPSSPAVYAVSTPAAIDAGSYRLTAKDFGLPLALTSLKTAIVQRESLVARLEQAGDLTTSLQKSRVKILVATVAASSGSNGLFGLTLAALPAETQVLETTQGVGGLFRSTVVELPAAGRYDFTLADLEFPAILGTSALAITSGTDVVAQIFGAGTVTSQQLAAGTYVFNFIGQPATDEQYGAYGLKVAESAPAPTVTFSATPSSITSGQQASLQWSSTNATACTASGGWSGAKAVSGTQQTGTLNANSTFDISCSGPGGSSNAAVTVTVNPPSASGGGGGGGSTSALLLLGMSLLAAARRTSRSM
jgi:hypothetical protein